MRPAFDSARRARPLLGTFVEVTAGGASPDRLDAAIERAFAAVAEVHRLMSFHEGGSDVSRLNRCALSGPLAVDPQTFEVLEWSRRFAEASEGCFDITVAAQLVDWRLLPRPVCAYVPDRQGSWRDVELLPDGTVRFRRPIWIDLGGIAKGYAVDRAIDSLRDAGIPWGCVNAGGDLRVLGREAARVQLEPRHGNERCVPVLEVANGSVASSGGGRRHRGAVGPHVHGIARHAVGGHAFVSVVADRCLVADALTKIVLTQGPRSEAVLCRYGARAHVRTARHEWRTIGGTAP